MKLTNPLRHPFRVPRVEKRRQESRFNLPNGRRLGFAEYGDPSGWGAYLASKGAFDMWLRSVTAELHADGIDVTSVYMGLIHTRMSAPTPSLRNLPGLSADQAADVVAKAIIERPRTIEPRWAYPGALVSGMLPGPFDRLTRLWYRYSADSTDAQGQQ